MFGLGTSELVLIFLVVFLLFGAKNLPEIAKGIGKSIRLFKDGFKDAEEQLKDSSGLGKKDAA